ncbi:MAG TPA: Crp/Fnr family transcriptional regulator [Candidatus Sulfotelmatobacter sp.]|nr:Crp/Fnr family transcriptional regulator [Candidatus Sulfotelmatobacter sp.]
MEAAEAPRSGGWSDPRLSGIAHRGFLGRLSHELIEELTRTARSAYYPKGTILGPATDRGPALVVSGMLRYFLSAGDGRQMTIRYMGPGDLVGSLGNNDANLKTHAEVLQPAVLLNLDIRDVRSLAARRPAFAEALLDETVSRVRTAYRTLSASAFMAVRSRVARDLGERAKISGTPLRPGLHLEVTQQALADATGSVREVVARALRELREENVIGPLGDGVTILDFDALDRIGAV